jgi:formamidase
VRIPAAPFMGVLGVAPDEAFLRKTLAYERSLKLDRYSPTHPESAVPATPNIARDGLSTIPPRSNGGNLDIRQLTVGSSLFLPVFVPGALFSAGDAHFAQGESECVTGLEMSATLVCRFTLHPGLAARQNIRDPQFRFSAQTRAGTRPASFHATTGQSFQYGDKPIHCDLNAAIGSALLNMIDYLGESRGYDFAQAYMICSLACDVRISQMVNTPNFTASVILDLGIFD